MASWYAQHLGMKVLRKVEGGTNAHWIADATGRSVVEIYRNEAAPVPDYANYVDCRAPLRLARNDGSFLVRPLHAHR